MPDAFTRQWVHIISELGVACTQALCLSNGVRSTSGKLERVGKRKTSNGLSTILDCTGREHSQLILSNKEAPGCKLLFFLNNSVALEDIRNRATCTAVSLLYLQENPHHCPSVLAVLHV